MWVGSIWCQHFKVEKLTKDSTLLHCSSCPCSNDPKDNVYFLRISHLYVMLALVVHEKSDKCEKL